MSSEYNRQFCLRVKKARTECTELTQEQMAGAIGAGASPIGIMRAAE